MKKKRKSSTVRWDDILLTWKKCDLCGLGSLADRKALFKTSTSAIQSDVMFIGEAPGTSENALGEPFVGPAGDILANLLTELLRQFNFSFFITNMLLCMPHNGDGRFRKPSDEEVNFCSPHLTDMLPFVNPKGIVFLGKVSAESDFAGYIRTSTPYPNMNTYHPSFILRSGGEQSYYFHESKSHILRFFDETLGLNANKSRVI